MEVAIAAWALVNGTSDRLIGWGGPVGRTKPVIFAIVGLVVLGIWARLPGPVIGTLPLAFLAWRTPAWGLFGGSINPAPSKAIFTLARHLVALVFLIPAQLGHLHMVPVGAAMCLFALAATVLALVNFLSLATLNWLIEFSRGCCLGIFLYAGFVLWQ